MEVKTKRQPTKGDYIAALVILGFIGWGLYVWLTSPTPPPKPQVTTYVTELGSYAALDPKTVEVQVGVKNTGQAAHAGSCVLTVTSTSGAYTGGQIFNTRELQPGKYESYTVHVSVSDEGAAYITSGHAECEDK